MRIRFCTVLLISGFACAAQARECVVLLPGIAMPWLTMSVLEHRLEGDGYSNHSCSRTFRLGIRDGAIGGVARAGLDRAR